jgi:hypothetical protein
MLRLERVNEIHEHAGASQRGEEEAFLELLVILLCETMDDPSGAADDVRGEIGTRQAQPPDRLVIDEQHPVQKSMASHEVLGEGNVGSRHSGRRGVLCITRPRGDTDRSQAQERQEPSAF